MAPEVGALEADLLHAAPEDGALEADLLSVESEANVLEDDPLMAVSEVRASLRRRHVGVTRRARRAALRAGALSRPAGRCVRAERSEAGSEFASQFCSCDPPLVRLNRVNDIICESQSRFQSCLSQNSLFTRAHVSCTMCGEFGGRHRKWGTSFLCIWGNKVVEYVYSD